MRRIFMIVFFYFFCLQEREREREREREVLLQFLEVKEEIKEK
jgi:preprotein translocase subunit YajC